MSAIYSAYKPLRNLLRTCQLDQSLIDVWQLSCRLAAAGDNPSLVVGVHPWELPTIVREVLLNGVAKGERRVGRQQTLGALIRNLRSMEEVCAKERFQAGDLWHEVRRLAHRQFTSVPRDTFGLLTRYLKIFGSPEVAPILERETGLTVREFFLLGIAISGHLKNRFDVNAFQDYQGFGIPVEKSGSFFKQLALSLEEVRELMLSTQKFDAEWEYIWNPLEAAPFVSLEKDNPNRLYCPVPDLLMRRFSYGLYYDLCKARGFDNAFGTSFSRYVGDVLQAGFPSPTFVVAKESPFQVKKGEIRHGVDWIVSGADANLFIECKTKRLSQAAKFSTDDSAIKENIGHLAEAVVQTYLNIESAKKGNSNWSVNNLPCVPLVVTLEDWFFFGPYEQEILEASVAERLSARGVRATLVDEMPYAVLSSRELELVVGTLCDQGFVEFFSVKRKSQYKPWMWKEYLLNRYPNPRQIGFHRLFQDAWSGVIPEMAFPVAARPQS